MVPCSLCPQNFSLFRFFVRGLETTNTQIQIRGILQAYGNAEQLPFKDFLSALVGYATPKLGMKKSLKFASIISPRDQGNYSQRFRSTEKWVLLKNSYL